MNKEILKEYGELKISAKSIADRLAELAPVILQEMLTAAFDKIPTSIGNFVIKKRKIWKYSTAVEDAKKTLDEVKEREEADGTAKFEEVDQLEFRETPKK